MSKHRKQKTLNYFNKHQEQFAQVSKVFPERFEGAIGALDIPPAIFGFLSNAYLIILCPLCLPE